ncbi:CPBP family intramembrane glutamic endopeptidase [Haloplanus sp. C73]|uniref:CPBP family intramembrane glutamic endopeptidase n=1 Tax=Haloplanus sp. C73 TaxID=3421641 RepID=UPI003EBE926F
MGLRGVVWNADERRPRAPVRICCLVVVAAVLGVAVSLLGSAGIGAWLGGGNGAVATTLRAVAGILVSGVTVSLAVAVTGRYIDRRRLRDFGLRIGRDWLLDYGFGLALGAGLMTLVFVVELAAGWIRITGTVQPRDGFLVRFAGLVVVFLAVGFYEELLLRGYLLTNAAEGLVGRLGDRRAVAAATIFSSLLFGVAHGSNPNATLVSTLAIVLAGGMLAAGYVLTGELAVPVGLHTTWNLFQGGVYGFPVSGLGLGVSVVGVDQRGPRLLTGGDFGPEAGLVGLGAMALGTLAIAGWARWRTGDLTLAPAVTTPELRVGDGTEVETERWEPAPGEES